MNLSVSSAASLITVLAAACLLAAPPQAQPPRGPAGLPADPAAILERLFGENTPEDEKALAAVKISTKEEEQLGHTAVQSYLQYLKDQKVRVLSRGKDADYLRRLVEEVRPLMAHADRWRRITVYVADSPRCDARSLPGGTLVFFRGLLEGAESEAALVGVVGHELSHLDRGHLLMRLRQMKLVEQTLSTQGRETSPDRLWAGTTAMARLWTRPFRPEDERAADLDGARWAYRAGYDPREMVRVIAKIAEREKQQPSPLPSIFRSHPPPEERRKAVLDLYEELEKAEPKAHLYIGKENLRRRTTRSQKEFSGERP